MSLSLYAMVALQRDSSRAVRGGDEVLRARRARVGLAALRHVDDLRRHRHARARPASRGVARTASANRTLLVFGLVFVVSGIAFKLGAVPYHMWVPDVYDGAPTAITLLHRHARRSSRRSRFMLRLLVGRAAAASRSTGRAC